MSHTDRLRKSPMASRRLTGITPSAFDGLLAQLAPRHEQAEARRKARPGRKRKPGGDRKHSLVLADRLLMLLNRRCNCGNGVDNVLQDRMLDPLIRVASEPQTPWRRSSGAPARRPAPT